MWKKGNGKVTTVSRHHAIKVHRCVKVNLHALWIWPQREDKNWLQNSISLWGMGVCYSLPKRLDGPHSLPGISVEETNFAWQEYTIIQPLCQATTDCAIRSDEMWTHFTYEDNNFYVMFECAHHTEGSKSCIPYRYLPIPSMEFWVISDMF